jgi:hypothetical protein
MHYKIYHACTDPDVASWRPPGLPPCLKSDAVTRLTPDTPPYCLCMHTPPLPLTHTLAGQAATQAETAATTPQGDVPCARRQWQVS